jgi:hypothetical protein
METCVTFTATLWFPKVYNFHFSYPWTRLFNTQQWFVSKNHISVATCLPIRFLETPTRHNINMNIQPTHFNPEDGGSRYYLNVGNIAYMHIVW